LERLIREAGVKRFTFHCLRHHGASTLDNAGVPIGVTQKLLGHEQRQTTELYLHSISGSERAAMEIFEEIRSKSHINPHIKDETHPEQVS